MQIARDARLKFNQNIIMYLKLEKVMWFHMYKLNCVNRRFNEIVNWNGQSV